MIRRKASRGRPACAGCVAGRSVQRGPLVALFAAGALLASSIARAQVEEDSARLPAERKPLVVESLLLDVTITPSRAVAVGERGHVLLSEDRQNWRQAREVPTRSTLTAVAAVGEALWAAGHDAVIIHSGDGGETWVLQHAAPATSAEDEPNPIFDIFFLDAERGFALGAYGTLYVTGDGGASWESVLIEELIAAEAADSPVAEEEEGDEAAPAGEALSYEDSLGDFEEEVYYDYHLNAMAQLAEGTLFIAGEAGGSYRSEDQGQSWIPVDMPYEGSMFGVISTPQGELLAFGLRGHVLRSADGGRSWEELETGTFDSLFGGTVLGDGTAVLVGANGAVLAREAGGGGFRSYRSAAGADLAGVAPVTGRTVIVVGEEGVARHVLGGGS